MPTLPARLRKPVVAGLCACELVLGASLILTAGRDGASAPAVTARAATALLFGVALAALNEMRVARPDVGCGCFGDLSDAPVSMRSLARAALLCAGALSSIGAPPLRLPSSAAQALLLLTAACAELLVIAALSPEISVLMVRLGYSEPCEARRLPVARTLAALRRSSAWRCYRAYLTAPGPADIWREGCWRFIAYPGAASGRAVDVVFAVSLRSRRPAVRATLVDALVEPTPIFRPRPPAVRATGVPAGTTARAGVPAAAAASRRLQRYAPPFGPRLIPRPRPAPPPITPPSTEPSETLPLPASARPRAHLIPPMSGLPRFTQRREPARHAQPSRQRSTSI